MDILIYQNGCEFKYKNLHKDHLLENEKEKGHLYVYKLGKNHEISYLVAAFSKWDYFLIEENERI